MDIIKCNQSKIDEVETRLIEKLKRMFPGSCYYTTFVTKWNDGTFKMEIRHGEPIVDGEECKIHTLTWYDSEIEYKLITAPGLKGTS